MKQVSPKLQRWEGMYAHYCPACKEMHPLPDRWKFNGDLEKPTFSPSFKHMMRWKDGEWVCHYVLTDGVLNYCGDCTHSMRGPVPLPDIPPELCE